MFRPLFVAVGFRYACSRHRFISFVGGLSLAGLALSVAVLVFVQAVTTGFERELEERILGVVPHIVIAGRPPVGVAAAAEFQQAVEGMADVVGASAVVEGVGLLATGTAAAGVRLTGIDPVDYVRVSRLGRFVVASEPAAGGLSALLRPGSFGLLLGAQAARRLALATGDLVTVVLPSATVTPLGAFARQKRFRVVGVVDTASQLDRHAAYLHRVDAARLFRLGDAVHGFHVRTAMPLAAERTLYEALRLLGAERFRGSTWLRSFGGIHEAIGMTRNILFVLLSLLVAVAAFNLVSSMVMIVGERRGDVAMLRTLGSSSALPIGAFVVHGAAIALLGTGVGIGIGMLFGVLAKAGLPWLEWLLGTPLMGEYMVSSLPVAFAGGDVALIAAMSLGLGLLATVLPARRAARLNPAEVLRYE